jgi:hypothetical protein
LNVEGGDYIFVLDAIKDRERDQKESWSYLEGMKHELGFD